MTGETPSLFPQGFFRLLLLSFLGWKGKGGRRGERGKGRKEIGIDTGLCDVSEARKPGTDRAEVGAAEGKLGEAGKLFYTCRLAVV